MNCFYKKTLQTKIIICVRKHGHLWIKVLQQVYTEGWLEIPCEFHLNLSIHLRIGG